MYMRESQMYFDTHESIKALVEQGIKETQAESIVKIVTQSRERDVSNLATKEQVKAVENKVDAVERDISLLRQDLNTLKQDFSTLRQDLNKFVTKVELNAMLNALEERLTSRIISANNDTLKWLIPFLAATVLSIWFKH